LAAELTQKDPESSPNLLRLDIRKWRAFVINRFQSGVESPGESGQEKERLEKDGLGFPLLIRSIR
jgi:hypothetical protein